MIRNGKGWSQGMLAARAGMSGAYISRLERNHYRSPGTVKLRLIATALGVALEDLTGERRGPPPPLQYPGARAYAVVRRNVSAGLDAWDDTGEYIWLKDEIARGRKLVAAPVTGTCMAPEIESGDTVVFDQGDQEPEPGELVVCTTGDGQLLVKRFYRLRDGSPLLVSNDGQRLKPNGLAIEGVVLQISKSPRRKSLQQLAAESPGIFETD